MGRKKIQITRIMDERNRQVSGVNFFGIIIYMDRLLHFLPDTLRVLKAFRAYPVRKDLVS